VLKVKVIDVISGAVAAEFSSMSGSLSHSLNEIEGLDGAVQIQLFIGAELTPVRSTRLLIKSQASIRQTTTSVQIKHEILPLNVLGAISGQFSDSESGEKSTFIDLFTGASCPALGNILPPTDIASSGLLESELSNVKTNDELAHCWARGSHIWNLETATGEKRKWDEATCSECKKETRFKTRGILAGSVKSQPEHSTPQESIAQRILIEHLPQVIPTPEFDLASIGFVLKLVNRGNYQKLSNLLEQFAYASDVRTIVGLLDSMGFINIIRDKYGRIEHWAVNPEIIPTNKLENALRLEASLHLASIVPNLSQVAKAIPKTSLANTTTIERFDLGTLKYFKVSHVELPGAYRFITAAGNLYAFLGESSNPQDSLQFGSPQLVKHLHALHERRLLFSYDPLTKKARVPLGCELPGLYGKILGVVNGTPPDKVRVGSVYFWEHDNIPEGLIGQLSSKLGN
jgi:hypothetical protein